MESFAACAEKELMILQTSVVYGPIHSRRLGNSLGINCLPFCSKFCNFDCVYCQYGWTRAGDHPVKLERARVILEQIEEAFALHRKKATPLDCITLAGNGEPTLHVEFAAIVEGLIGLRDRYFPGVKTGILSNSSQVHREDIRQSLQKLDGRYMKLDAGYEDLLRKISRPRGDFFYERMLDGLRALPDKVLQSLFIHGRYDNTKPDDLKKWFDAVGYVRPSGIHVYSVDRQTADEGIVKVPRERLEAIAAQCQAKAGISVHVYD